MKVVLFALNASFSHTNLAIRRLRPSLVKAGFDVSLLEGGLRDADSSLLETLYKADSDVYAFSCYIWNITRMLSLAKDLKAIRPDSKIIFGGPEVSFDTERFATLDFIDTVIVGAGENAAVSVCNDIRLGNDVPSVLDGGKTELSDGILYSDDDEIRTTLYYESSVGCPFSCAFCLSSATHGISSKSVEQTLSELLEFEKLTGDIMIKFVDRTFNYDINRANAIWKALLSPSYTKRYQFEICASLLNEESFDILSKFESGKIQLEAGLQSTNEQTLKTVSRHLDVKKTLENCKRIQSCGNVHVHLDLIAGLPYETYSSFKRSFNDAFFCCDQLQLGFLKLLHGTSLRNNAEKYGYRFMSEPPYTVLQNDAISYTEIRRLDGIADLTERYYNSRHFVRTLEYALSFASSPFELFEGLLDFISKTDGRSIRKISQSDAYRLLFAFASRLDGIDQETLDAKLHEDYSSFEVRKLPKFKK